MIVVLSVMYLTLFRLRQTSRWTKHRVLPLWPRKESFFVRVDSVRLEQSGTLHHGDHDNGWLLPPAASTPSPTLSPSASALGSPRTNTLTVVESNDIVACECHVSGNVPHPSNTSMDEAPSGGPWVLEFDEKESSFVEFTIFATSNRAALIARITTVVGLSVYQLDHGRLQVPTWTVERVKKRKSVGALRQHSPWTVHSTSTQSYLKVKFSLKDSFSFQRFMHFSASRRLATILSRFSSSCSFSFRPSTRSRSSSATRASSSCVVRSSCISSFFVSSRSVCDKLLGHNVFASMSHFVSILSLRARRLSFI